MNEEKYWKNEKLIMAEKENLKILKELNSKHGRESWKYWKNEKWKMLEKEKL